MSKLFFVFLAGWIAAFGFARSTPAATPCFEHLTQCRQQIRLAGSDAHVQVYASHPLDERHDTISHAVVVVHGQGRNADGYFRHAMAGAFLAHALQRTIVVSPRLASSDGQACRDTLSAGEAGWVCAGPDSWRVGGPARNHAGLNSFQVMDEILTLLARRDRFPALQSVVVVGHSAGGQYVSRYAMANGVHERLGLPVEYVVGNPSSYTYLDDLRPVAAPPAVADQAQTPRFRFAPGAAGSACDGFNQWPYGSQRRVGITATLSDESLRRQLIARPVTYLLGEIDILPLYGFDASCAAMAQGPTRLARGLAYTQYVNETLGARHRALVVPACGHDARCMFSAEAALPVIYKSVRD